METKTKKRKFTQISLFYRLFAIYGITFILLFLTLAYLSKSEDEMIEKYSKLQLNQLSHFLSEEIGFPPNEKLALEYSKDLNLHIEIISGDKQWDSGISIKKFLNDDIHNVVHIQKDGVDFYFLNKSFITFYSVWGDIGVFLFLTPILLFITNLLVAYVFKPLKDLLIGARKISQGDFDVNIPVTSEDELGELSNAFNSMSSKISSQFKDMKNLLLGLAHEFRTPMTRIKLNLEKIENKEIKQLIDNDLDLLNKLTQTILDQERLDQKPEVLELIPINIVEMVQKHCSKYNKIEFNCQHDEILADIDTKQFSLALSNFIQNSLRYCKSKVEVEIQLSSNSQNIEILIHDDGPGIDKTYLNEVMKPFFRVDESRTGDRKDGGFGLGLSLANSIVQAHSGKVNLANKVGLEVKITIPKIEG